MTIGSGHVPLSRTLDLDPILAEIVDALFYFGGAAGKHLVCNHIAQNRGLVSGDMTLQLSLATVLDRHSRSLERIGLEPMVEADGGVWRLKPDAHAFISARRPTKRHDA